MKERVLLALIILFAASPLFGCPVDGDDLQSVPSLPGFLRHAGPFETVVPDATTSPFAGDDLYAEWADAVYSRTAGITEETCTAVCDAAICPTCPGIQLFDVYDNATLTYQWSATGWAADLDLTSGPVARGCVPGWVGEACSVLNETYTGTYTGVMISPVHLLLGHTNPFPEGTHVILVDKENNVSTRVCGAGATISPGLHMNILTEAVPEGIGIAKVLPPNWTSYVPGFTTTALPILYTHQWHDAALAALYWLLPRYVEFQTPPPASMARLWEDPQPGDSSTAAFAFVAGETVAITVWHYSYPSGPDLARWITEINAAMATLGGGYELQVIDLSGYRQP